MKDWISASTSLLLLATLVLCKQSKEARLKTKYACQGSKLRLRCRPNDRVLQIVNAQYGRLQKGSSICPHKNASNTKCRDKDSFGIIYRKCNNKWRCNIKVDSTMFPNDPCPGTYKYLMVIYKCVAAPDTTRTKPTKRRPTTNTSPTNSTGNGTGSPSVLGLGGLATTEECNVTEVTPQANNDNNYVHRDRPKYVLIIFLSGVAAATVLLLILLVALNFLGKRKARKGEMADGAIKSLDQLPDDDEDDNDDDDDDENKKTVTIEIQGGDHETKQISVNPGDIIIIDSKDVDNDDSEDLGYMSEIVRYYNSRNNTHDDGISIRKQSLTCETPSVLSIPNSEGDKREDYDNFRQQLGNGAVVDGTIGNGSCVS